VTASGGGDAAVQVLFDLKFQTLTSTVHRILVMRIQYQIDPLSFGVYRSTLAIQHNSSNQRICILLRKWLLH